MDSPDRTLAPPELQSPVVRALEYDILEHRGWFYPSPTLRDARVASLLQSDPQGVKKYFGDLTLQGRKEAFIDYLFSSPLLHDKYILPDESGTLSYFGRRWQLAGAPQAKQLFSPSFGIVIAYDDESKPIAGYRIDPRVHTDTDKVDIAEALTPEDLITTAKPIDDTEWSRFITQLPELYDQLVQIQFETGPVTPAIFSLRQQYDIWRSLSSLSESSRNNFLTKMKQCSPGALFVLQNSFTERELETVLNILNQYEDSTSLIFDQYTDITTTAIQYAWMLKTEEISHYAIVDQILDTANGLFQAAIALETNDGLTSENVNLIYTSLLAQKYELELLIKQDSVTAQKLQEMVSFIPSLLRLDTDPRTQIVFRQLIQLWVTASSQLQADSPYNGKVAEITTQFYKEYAELDQNADTTTADTQQELRRYQKSFDNDKNQYGDRTGIDVAFIGIGSGQRIERHIIDYIQTEFPTSTFTGVDLIAPQTPLDEVTYLEADMQEVGDLKPAAFDRMYLIWSPFMDILELKNAQATAHSLSSAMKPGGVIEIDLHFPYGVHSYEKNIQEYHQLHPEEPIGIFEKGFPSSDGRTITKPFFAYNPPQLIHLFESAGLMPITDVLILQKMIQDAQQDDSFIQSTEHVSDNKASAVYRTSSGLNRITLKFRKP